MSHKQFLVIFFIFCCSAVKAQIPQNILGNWINNETNHWEYGFFEHFAIYESNFWDYEAIHTKRKYTKIALKKGGKTIHLKLSNIGDSSLNISHNTRTQKFRLNRAGFSPYPHPDHTTFKDSDFKPDTVTIIGYYRNLYKYNKAGKKRQGRGPFVINIYGMGQKRSYHTDFDSQGRFKIEFPVFNAQEVYLDWKRLTKKTVVEPGETLFLFADMEDFIVRDDLRSRDDFFAFVKKPKEILLMGENARIHNELVHYRPSMEQFNVGRVAKKASSEMEYLTARLENYQSCLKHLQQYINRQPNLSDRFKTYTFAGEKYQMASDLMAYPYKGPMNKNYLDFVNTTVDFDDEKLFTLIREFSWFMQGYIGYYQRVKSSHIVINSGETIEIMTDKKMFSEEEEAVLAKFKEYRMNVVPQLKEIIDTTSKAKILEPYYKTIKKYNGIVKKREVKEYQSELFAKRTFKRKLHYIDSLIHNQSLKDLLIADYFYGRFESTNKPLYPFAHTIIDTSIKKKAVKSYLLARNKHYIDLSKQEVTYEASLKDTAHLKEFSNADSLFQQLISPYKGKVIYLDFWGTWCGPCRQQMPFVGAVKEALEGKDVIFMYLANKSPEKSWKNVIKEMDLAGKNVVHYRLPDEQQAMIERMLAINSFPTYMLINKAGKIITNQAPRPQQKSALVEAINKQLKTP